MNQFKRIIVALALSFSFIAPTWACNSDWDVVDSGWYTHADGDTTFWTEYCSGLTTLYTFHGDSIQGWFCEGNGACRALS